MLACPTRDLYRIYFLGHKNINSLEMCCMTQNKLQTCVIPIHIHCQGVTDDIYEFEHLFCSFIYLPIHYPSNDISTCLHQVVPIQMMGGCVCLCTKLRVQHSTIMVHITMYLRHTVDINGNYYTVRIHNH